MHLGGGGGEEIKKFNDREVIIVIHDIFYFFYSTNFTVPDGRIQYSFTISFVGWISITSNLLQCGFCASCITTCNRYFDYNLILLVIPVLRNPVLGFHHWC